MSYLIITMEFLPYFYNSKIDFFTYFDHLLNWYLYIEIFILTYKTIFIYTYYLFFYIQLINYIFNNNYLFLKEYKLNLNDSLPHLISFFWTHPTYLIFFFFLLLSFFASIYFYKTLIILWLTILTYFNENLNIYNGQINLIIFYQNNYNFFLINYLNQYHPGLFYLNINFFLYMCVLMFFILYNYKRIFNSSVFFFSWTCYNIKWTFIIFLTLLLGSWWAFQEAAWGGWWNWDYSEIFGILFFLTTLYLIHKNYKFFWNFYLNNILFTSFFCFIIFYLFLQISFKLSSHNFGEKFFFFYSNNFFFFELIFIFFVMLIFYWKSQIRNFTQFNLTCYLSTKISVFWGSYWLLFFLVNLFYISFNPILHYFLWIFFTINMKMYFFNLYSVLVILYLLIFFLYLFQFNSYFVIYYSYLFQFNFFIFKKFNLIWILHQFFFFFFTLNLINTRFSLYANYFIYENWSYNTNFYIDWFFFKINKTLPLYFYYYIISYFNKISLPHLYINLNFTTTSEYFFNTNKLNGILTTENYEFLLLNFIIFIVTFLVFFYYKQRYVFLKSIFNNAVSAHL